MYTTDELKAVWERREADPLLLLVVVGKVYDVSSGRTFYGSEGAGYEGFASGSDNSRAFLTADFEHNATDDLDNLTHAEHLGVAHWAQFYEDHAKYTYAGVHRGRFFDYRGRTTPARRAFERNVAVAKAERAAHVAFSKRDTGQGPSAAPVLPQGTPSGSGWLWVTGHSQRLHPVTAGGARAPF